ncbi:protein CutA homolog isoform X2 [Pararge aegeria]|uniref:protein CutA homolog isoform X2 n=1 Tax=Pararge aegeria TaxID=116150 RepID=UPI0019D0CA44|nr:protein CutA homolog isoform X2 [Pararge aegeria]
MNKRVRSAYVTCTKWADYIKWVKSSKQVIQNDDKFSVAYVTVPSKDVGKSIALGLVKNKLAACVNIVPEVTSIYEWEDEINEDTEALLMIKTRTSQVDQLTEYVRSVHPYEVCEVISLPIKNGNPPYLKWIGDMVPEKS